MSVETPAAPGATFELPDIHVWMSPEEAAEALSVPVAEVDHQLDSGDLECRVSDEGDLQVLIALPKPAPRAAKVEPLNIELRPPEPGTAETAIERVAAAPAGTVATVSIGDTMLPLVHAMRRAQVSDDARKARRSARFAWAAAAAILLAAGGTTALSVTSAMRAKALADAAPRMNPSQTNEADAEAERAALIADKATLAAAHETLSQANADLAAKLLAVSTERDQLKGQLSQVNTDLHKAEEQLVVERNVEDQLINAALATHAAKAGQPKNQVVADTSN